MSHTDKAQESKKDRLKTFWGMYSSAWKEGCRALLMVLFISLGYFLWSIGQKGPYSVFFAYTALPASILIFPVWCYFVSRICYPELSKGKMLKGIIENDNAQSEFGLRE